MNLPWYLDPIGVGALPRPYTDAVNTLKALSNASPGASQASSPGVFGGTTSGGYVDAGVSELPGQVAYAIDTLQQSVAQFSPGDVQAVQSTGPYQTLVAQMNAVIANGDFSPGSDQPTTNYYTSKGNYNVASVAAAANQLIGFVSGLTGGGGPTQVISRATAARSFAVAPLPTEILTSKPGNIPNGSQLYNSAAGSAASSITTQSSTGQVVGGPVPAVFPPVSVGPSSGAPPQVNNPNQPYIPLTNQPQSGSPPPPGQYVPGVTPGATTDPSTGATTVTVTNPDGSTTTTTDNGPGGEPNSVTTPAPYFYFFHPRDDAGKLVLALGIGAMAMGLIVLAVNSKEGEKVLEVVAKPVDDAAKAVGIPADATLIPDLPVFGPTLNPLPRRRRRRNPCGKWLKVRSGKRILGYVRPLSGGGYIWKGTASFSTKDRGVSGDKHLASQQRHQDRSGRRHGRVLQEAVRTVSVEG